MQRTWGPSGSTRTATTTDTKTWTDVIVSRDRRSLGARNNVPFAQCSSFTPDPTLWLRGWASELDLRKHDRSHHESVTFVVATIMDAYWTGAAAPPRN